MTTHWLFLRGLAREQRHWGTFPATFAREIPDVQVHLLDAPGFGTESSRPSPLTVRGIADDIRERWLPLRDAFEGPWRLFSISLGGMVAMDWIARFGDDFVGAVLTNSSAGGLTHFWQRMNPKVLPGVLGSALERDPAVRERRILGLTTNLRNDLDVLSGQWAAFSRDRPPARGAAASQLWAASRFRVPATIRTPLLVLNSAQDGFTAPACSQRIAKHFQAPIDIHPRAGHDLPTDDPQWVTAHVRAWLATQ